MKSHVALVGFMAAGKSTIGARVARALEREFIDTDAMIAREHGPIPEIFARLGEPAFRAFEFEAAQRAFRGEPRIVSLGGGALSYEPTRVLVASSAVRVYLDASPATILQRVRRSRTVRPLLGASPTPEAIEALLAARLPYYLAAEIVVPVDGRRIAQITRDLVERLSESGVAA
jgi:shikimate kinase